MHMLVHPALADLKYIDALVSNKDIAETVKTKIVKRFTELAVEMAEKAAEEDHENASGGEDLTLPVKRGRASRIGKRKARKNSDGATVKMHPMFTTAGTEKAQAESNEYEALGLFEVTKDAGPAPRTIREKVKQELTEFKAMPGVTLANLSTGATLGFWKVDGAREFPNMARAARVLLGAPASAAVLERDFSAAGRMMTSIRNSTDSAWVEIILFLNGNQGNIPANIPHLTDAEVEAAIPGRLKTPDPDFELLEGAIVADAKEGDVGSDED